MRDQVFNTIKDLVSDFLYYDRKEDDLLPVGRIEELVKTQQLSVDDIVNKFREQLEKRIKQQHL